LTSAEKILSFYKSLQIKEKLPKGVEVLNPYRNEQTFALCERFYKKYYHDERERKIILGINPGRFGAGLTGIPFMDPLKLEHLCNIKSDFPKKSELSADFIHLVIQSYGGLDDFFHDIYINSVSPLGFTLEGKNLNYYDSPALLKSLEPFILSSLRTQINFGVSRDVAYCLGEGANFKYLSRVNEREKFFGEIIPLAHPRFVMQYKRKFVKQYVDDYVRKLSIKKD